MVCGVTRESDTTGHACVHNNNFAVYGLDGIRHVACLQNVVLDVMNFSSYHLKPALLTEFLKNKKTFGKK